MTTYIARRVFWMVWVLFAIIVVNFMIVHYVPANPAKVILGPHASPSQIRLLDYQMGLDRPVWVQFWVYVNNLLHGNLGYSFVLHQSVSSVLGQALPYTATLALYAVTWELILGLPLGLLAALKKNTWVDNALMTLSMLALSTPIFYMGTVLLYIFPFLLGIGPLGGPGQFGSGYILPGLSIGIVGGPVYMRLLRTAVLDVRGQDYVRTARAKGLSERMVVFRHIVRNATMPVVTYFGLDLSSLLAGVIVTEGVFDIPGLGNATIKAIADIDLPVIMGVVIVGSVLLVVANLLVDLSYAVLDPRISYH